MYDLKTDPLERINLAYKLHKRTPEVKRQYRRLRRKLARRRGDPTAASRLAAPGRRPPRRALGWYYGSSIRSTKAVPRVSAVVAFEHPPRLAVHISRRGQRWQQER
jgi:hypothetical protein